jgi:hypothetical protein
MREKAFVLLMSLLGTPLPAAAQDNCDHYADRSLQQIAQYDQLQCEMPPAPGFWVPDRQALYDDCARQGAQSPEFVEGNLETGRRVLEECGAMIAEAGGGSAATVNTDVDLYEAPGGEGSPIGVVREGERFARTRCLANNWCQVPGGWVWGDFLDR